MKSKWFIRIGTTAAAVCLAAASLAGCGSKTESSSGSGQPEEKKYDLGGRTVTLASWGSLAPNENDPNYANQVALVEEIEAKYHCKLDYYTTNDYHTYTSAILTTALSGNIIADAFWGHFQNIVPQWANNNLVAPIDDYFDFSLDMWNKNETDAWTLNGKHYGITNWIDNPGHMILFNKKIVSDNNITPESLYKLQADGEWTWDKLSEFAIKCTRDTDNDGETDTWGFGSYGTSPFSPEPFIYSNGSSPVLLSQDLKYTYNLEDPKVVEAMEFGHKLVYQDKVCDMSSKDWGYWEALWKRGRIAFYEAPSWVWSPYYDVFEEAGLEYGILFIPKGPQATDYVNAQSGMAGIFMQPGVQDKEAIAALITDFEKPQSWKTNYDVTRSFQNRVFDDESLNTISQVKNCSVSLKGEVATWFRDNVLWSDWGIKDNIPAKTFIAQQKAPSQAAMDAIWNSELTVPTTAPESEEATE